MFMAALDYNITAMLKFMATLKNIMAKIKFMATLKNITTTFKFKNIVIIIFVMRLRRSATMIRMDVYWVLLIILVFNYQSKLMGRITARISIGYLHSSKARREFALIVYPRLELGYWTI
jgi:hypothetical protein